MLDKTKSGELSGNRPNETFTELVQRRPKVARKRAQDRELRNLIRSFDLNRRYGAGDAALVAFEAVYSRKPVEL